MPPITHTYQLPALGDFSITRGDSLGFTISLQQDGNDMDLTGATFSGRVRSGAYVLDLVQDAEIQITGSTVTVSLSAAQTALLAFPRYAYDVQMTTADAEVYTLAQGKIILNKQIA